MSQQLKSKVSDTAVFTVNNIIGEVSAAGNVRVTVCSSLFNKLIGKTPIIAPNATSIDQNGIKWKKYEVDGTVLYSRDVINENGIRKTEFLMNAEEATKRHVPIAGALATESFVA